MVRLIQERILLIGDDHREMEPVLAQAVPAAQVTRVENVFDGIAELSAHDYSAIVANAEPIERRPEAAVRTLRALAGEGRLILFGHPTLEPISRKMLEFGCDDYVVTPASPGEIQQIFVRPVMRLATPGGETQTTEPADDPAPTASMQGAPTSLLQTVPLAELMLEALLQHPGAAPSSAIKAINELIGPALQLDYQPEGKDSSAADGRLMISLPVRSGSDNFGQLHLSFPDGESENASRHFLSQAAQLLGKVVSLQDRHRRLEKLAITDQLTGVYNRRYFEHFLAKVLDKAKTLRFQVTLLLFDIDNFKKYNDECGHAMGDEILRETASLMRRCCREHDLVARIGGDEFAVVFWEKEGPRQPKQSDAPIVNSGRLPQEPLQILKRFRRLISSREFSGLGAGGRGSLTISGGLASFPWDGRDVTELVDAADRALTFGAKKGGKNSIYLVGGDEQTWGEEPPPPV